MKKALTLVVLCLSFWAVGQVNVGPKIKVVGYSPDKFDDGAIRRLKQTKTYFIYGEQDREFLEDWKKALKKSWTVTPFGVMSIKEFNKLSPQDWKNKTFIIKYQDTYVWDVVNDKGITQTKSLAYPCLTVIKIKPEGEYYFYCRIDLTPNPKTSGYTRKFHRLSQKEKGKYLYNEAEFFNWYPGLLMAPLGFVSKSLEQEEPISIFKSIKRKVELGELKTKTLFVPEYAFIRRWGFDRDKPNAHIKKVTSEYNYRIRIVSAEQLSELIMENDKEIHVLFYSTVINEKFISVWNTKNCELLYKRYKANSNHIKSSDFRKLSKAIRKASSKAEKQKNEESKTP